MKITFDFNEVQTKALKSLLEASLVSLESQRASLTMLLSKQNDPTDLFSKKLLPSELEHVNNYITSTIVPQQLMASGILSAIVEAEQPIIQS